jgi:mono/diheme cytochrome c family protein
MDFFSFRRPTTLKTTGAVSFKTSGEGVPVLYKETISLKERLSMMPHLLATAMFAGAMIAAPVSAPLADEGDDDGVPQYVVKDDGSVNKATYQGYRRYHMECHRCHGADGLGHLAPDLVNSLKTMDYETFMDIAVNGVEANIKSTGGVMPGFGTNPNLGPYLDNIYMYLKARADGKLATGRPDRFDRPTLD